MNINNQEINNLEQEKKTIEEIQNKAYQDLTTNELEIISDNILFGINNGWEIGNGNPVSMVRDKIKIHNNYYQDLEVFLDYEHSTEKSIYNKINKTTTTIGNLYLKHLLQNPTNNTEILISRQNLIKNLINNPHRLKQIDIHLKKIKKLESKALWFWKPLNQDLKELYNTLYFNNKWLNFLNTNSLVMSIYYNFHIIMYPLWGIISPILFFLVPYIILRFFYKIPISFSFYYKILKGSFFGGSSVGLFNIMGGNFIIVQYIIKFIYGGLYIYSLYATFKTAYQTQKMINMIHQKINHLSLITIEINQLVLLVKNDFNTLLGTNINETIPLDYLDDKIYSEEPHIFNHKGKILSDYYNLLFNNQSSKLKNYFHSLAIIDCYVSLSKLYLEHQTTTNKYTFVNYLKNNNTKPKIIFKEIWHPYFDPNSCISNNLNMDSDKNNNMIITGANTSGKSTFIKAVSLSLLFCHTLGITSSTEASITPFALINTYLNIPDTKGKESLFEAEVNRAYNHLNEVKELNKEIHNNFAFVCMDEIFNSTNPQEGIAGAYIIGKSLGKYKNSLCLITTHFNYLTTLEKTNNFRNCYFSIDKDGNKDYKIKDGISNQKVGLEILSRKGFDPKLIKEAKELANKLEKHEKIFLQQTKNKNKIKTHNQSENKK